MVEYLKDASALKPAEWIQKHRQRVDELTTESQYLIKVCMQIVSRLESVK